MRKLLIGFVSILSIAPVWADIAIDPLLNKVNFTLNAEQWVTSKTALVNIGVNASVSDIGLDKVQSEVLDKLNKLSNKGEWHIVSFNRSLDSSGLERVQISAQARLPNNELAGMRDRAKAISKPGETYTVDTVEFTPSEDEIRDAKNMLRTNIYQQAKAEIARLNKEYPEQKYYLHWVDFQEFLPPVPMAANAMYMKAEAARVPSAAPLAVGDKLRMSANITLVANPDAELGKLILQQH